jgi:hypothetical protein
MKTFWESSDREELSTRMALLTPEKSPLWGQMTARQMLAHVVDALRMAMGDIKTKEIRLPIRFTPLKQLIIYGPPFPKSSPTAPELQGRQADDWDSECTTLCQLMDSFAALPPENKFPPHPAFGTLSRRAWGVLEYKHLDHHLRQFGV